MPRTYYVYILASTFKKLYTGVTNDLAHRIHEHKSRKNPNSFTARHNIHKLVYFESFGDINSAIARESEIKGWLRIKKIQTIVSTNPTWHDLSLDWGKPTEPFDESAMRPPETF